MNYYKQIDSVRFFAAFLVLIAHWLHSNPMVKRMEFGFLAVDFFFIISGFLISFQLFTLGERVQTDELKFSQALKSFMVRRVLRIFPLYYFVMILATLANDGAIRDAFWYNLTYTSNFYFISVGHWTSTFSHFWSLSVEEYFYLAWPFIAITVRKRFLLWAAFAIALCAFLFRLYHLIHGQHYFMMHIHTISCLDLFMFGAVLSYVVKWHHVTFRKVFENPSVRWFILLGFLLSYAIIVVIPSAYFYRMVLYRITFGVFGAAFLGLLVIGFKGRVGQFLEHKWLLRGGTLSYAIYIIHNFVPGMLMGIKTLKFPLAVNISVYFIVTIILSELLYRWIENPIRKIGSRYKI